MKVEDTDEHVKTVYAHFGLAIYLAQVLEHGLVNALVFLDLFPRRTGKPVPRTQWEDEFDAFMEGNFKATLGKMIRTLKDVVSVPSDLEITLEDALRKRNFLAHAFFRERADEFMSRAGRDQMIEELEAAQEIFVRADERLSGVTEVVREKYGFSDAKVEELLNKHLRGIQNDL